MSLLIHSQLLKIQIYIPYTGGYCNPFKHWSGRHIAGNKEVHGFPANSWICIPKMERPSVAQ